MAEIGTETLVSLNTLVFGSLEFLFRYLPLFLLLYFVFPQKYRTFVLFAYSILLYACGEPYYVFLLLGMTLVNYLFGRVLYPPPLTAKNPGKRQRERKRKGWFVTAVACNVLLLAYFKLSDAFDTYFMLPVGISFYIFKSISYLTDVYRGIVKEERSFVRFGTYLCMFPQVVSGPIMRYEDARKGLASHPVKLAGLENGLVKIVEGLAAKVLIADRLGMLWNDIQTIGFESISPPLAWLGAASYSLELYFDFAGYSLIAAGIGEMIGFPVIRNFDQPYASRSVSEFYRRWHMTLGSWFRDYVYIPLGGNRRGTGRTVCNLLLVWALTGFWHGGSLNFILWGLVLGLLIILEKFCYGGFLKKHTVFSHIYLLFIIPLTWMLFAIPSLKEIAVYFGRLFPFMGRLSPLFGGGILVNRGDFWKELTSYAPSLVAAVFFCIPVVCKWFDRHKKNTVVVIALAIVFWMVVYQLSNAANNPFMYANY